MSDKREISVWFKVEGNEAVVVELNNGAYISNLQKTIKDYMTPLFDNVPVPHIIVKISGENVRLSSTVELATLIGDGRGIGTIGNPLIVDIPQEGILFLFGSISMPLLITDD
jgi:hypothetical protein